MPADHLYADLRLEPTAEHSICHSHVCVPPSAPDIDDLDRCKPDKVVEVLESLVLLTANTPFVIVLAVDPSVIVQAVETVTKGVFGDAGVNGHEYLDKLVQMTFVPPQLANSAKSTLACKLADSKLDMQVTAPATPR